MAGSSGGPELQKNKKLAKLYWAPLQSDQHIPFQFVQHGDDVSCVAMLHSTFTRSQAQQIAILNKCVSWALPLLMQNCLS